MNKLREVTAGLTLAGGLIGGAVAQEAQAAEPAIVEISTGELSYGLVADSLALSLGGMAIEKKICTGWEDASMTKCLSEVEVPDDDGGSSGGGNSNSSNQNSNSNSSSNGGSSNSSGSSNSGSGSGGSGSGGSGSGNSGGGNSSGGSSSNGNSGGSGSSSQQQSPPRPSWDSLLVQHCEDQAGNADLSAQLDEAIDPNGQTDWEKGSGRLGRSVLLCAGDVFIDVNGDGFVTEADIDPETGVGVTVIDQLLTDDVVLRGSTNDMTPNVAQQQIWIDWKRSVWNEQFPQETVLVVETTAEPITSETPSQTTEAVAEDVVETIAPQSTAVGFALRGAALYR